MERQRALACHTEWWLRPRCQHIMGHNGKSSISATYVGEWDWQWKWHWHCKESRSWTLYPQSSKFFSFLTSLNSSKSRIGTRVQRSLHLLDKNACDDGILGWEKGEKMAGERVWQIANNVRMHFHFVDQMRGEGTLARARTGPHFILHSLISIQSALSYLFIQNIKNF